MAIKTISKGIKKQVNIADIMFDEELYPRSKPNWMTILDYRESMVSGAVFPPIILAIHNKKMYLVDGKHRIEARKQLKHKSISAIVHINWTKQKIFLEAVRTNIAHGHQLSPYEKRMIAQKLLEMKMKKQEVSNLIQVPMNKLDNFIGSRLVNAVTGAESSLDDAYKTGEVILKSSIKHLAGETIEGNIDELQKDYFGRSQRDILKHLVSLLKTRTIDETDEDIMKLLSQVKTLLKKYKI